MKTFQLSIIALRESFLAILPYTITTAMSVLAIQLAGFLGLEFVDFASFFIEFFPFVLFTSIIYQFSIRHNVDFIISFLISILIILFIDTIFLESNASKIFNSHLTPFMLVVPITTVLTLRNYDLKPLNLLFSSNDAKGIWYTFTIFSKVLIAWTVAYIGIYILFSYFRSYYYFALPSEILLAIRTFFVQLFWFFGMHGNNLYGMVANNDFMTTTLIFGMNYREFLHFFMVLGGSGMIVSLITAILLFSRDKHSRKIAIISIPFSLFNIGEVVVFGLPIVLNRYILIPFILIPILNIWIVFHLLELFPLVVVHHNLAWSTPIFINIYYATDGSWLAVAMQAGIYILDTMLYIPFVLRYSKTQAISNHYKILKDTLGIGHLFREKKRLTFYEAKESIIESNIRLESIIDLLSKNKLQIYLQPIVEVNKNKTSHFEALLRLELQNGTVLPPYFLEDIEKSGLASIIDIWACREVKKHIDSTGIKRQININLHSDTLEDADAVGEIITILNKENIAFEIVERKLLDNKRAVDNLYILRNNGFKIYIDDVGEGYSSYLMLCTLPIDAIKIDKSLVDIIHTKNGYKVVAHIYDLSQSLGYNCIVEGVETKEQLTHISKTGINYVQGYYYSRALCVEDALEYEPEPKDTFK